jgi:uncharacterized cupredoxin-like copper-binding protein
MSHTPGSPVRAIIDSSQLPGGIKLLSRHKRLLTLGFLTALLAIFAAIPAVAGATSKATTVNVSITAANDFLFKLSTKTVKAGTVTFKITNTGNLPHDFKICASNKGGTANACAGKVTPMINPPAGTGKLTVTLKAGKYEYLCTVSGHAAAGMKGVLTVK